MANLVLSNWTVEVLQPGQDSEVRTHCASIRIRNTSAAKKLYIAPKNSSYRLPVPPGGVWGIDLTNLGEELETVIEVYTREHDAEVIVEQIFKRSA